MTTPTTQDSVTESNTQPSTNHINVNTTVVDRNVDQFPTSWNRAHDTVDSSVNVTTNQIGEVPMQKVIGKPSDSKHFLNVNWRNSLTFEEC